MGSRGHSVRQTGLQVACPEGNSWPRHVLVHVSRKRTSEMGMSTVAAGGQPESLAHAPAVRTHTAVLNQAPRNRTGGGEDDDDRTHADVQVLQEGLQEAGAHAQRPHALMAPRRLDPWAQVLGKRGLHTGASLGDSPGSRSARTTSRSTSLPGHPSRRWGPAGQVRAGHPALSSAPSLCCWLGSDTATPGGPRAWPGGAGCS